MSARSKTALRVALIAMPLVAFVLYAALNWFVIEVEDQRVGAGVEANENPYLAFHRLLAKTQAGATSTDAPSKLDAPPEKGVVILASRRLVYMNRQRIDRIMAWVERGGLLVVEAEPSAIDDPLLEAFGIARQTPEERIAAGRSPPGSHSTRFDWSGKDKPLRLEIPGLPLNESTVHLDATTAGSLGEAFAFAFSWGEGRVVAFSSFAFLRNGLIGSQDHAQLAWEVATAGPDGTGAVIFLRPPKAQLGPWLLAEAWTVLVAAALLLLLWLARVVPRFGPLAPDPQPVRRRLVEHIAASGRYLWSRGEGAHLLAAARERASQAAARRFPGLKTLPTESAVTKVAEAAATTRAKVQRALVAPAETTASFLAAIAALRDLESRLARRGAPTLSTKELS